MEFLIFLPSSNLSGKVCLQRLVIGAWMDDWLGDWLGDWMGDWMGEESRRVGDKSRENLRTARAECG
jgi:hypothetical protein